MTSKEFVQCFHRSKQEAFALYCEPELSSAVGLKIASLDLTAEQLAGVREALDFALTDTYYTILLALDGAANLGGVQQPYQVLDETGAVVCKGNGEIGVLAYAAFYSQGNA